VVVAELVAVEVIVEVGVVDGELVWLVVADVVGVLVSVVVGLEMWQVANVPPSLCESIAKLNVSTVAEQSLAAWISPLIPHVRLAVVAPRL
jgi:hypothetical protein